MKKNSSGGDHSSASNSPMGSFKATSSKKGEKVLDILSWDLALIKAELEALRALQADCRGAFAQVGFLEVYLGVYRILSMLSLFRSTASPTRWSESGPESTS